MGIVYAVPRGNRQQQRRYDPYRSELPQPPPSVHHWHLANLRAALAHVAHAQGARSELDYLLRAAEVLSASDRDLALYAAAVCCAGNCWLIGRAAGVVSPGVPLLPPGGVRVLELELPLQGVRPVACFFQAREVVADGGGGGGGRTMGVLYFRGTTTLRETWTDIRAAWSPLVSLAGPRRRSSEDGGGGGEEQRARFSRSFWRAYVETDNRSGASRRSFARECARECAAGGGGRLLVVGHSLGGAFAQLAAYEGAAVADVSVATVASAQGGDARFCRELRRRCRRVLSVANLRDYVPWLHSFRAEDSQVCEPLLTLNASQAGVGPAPRLHAHDPAYYAMALLAVESGAAVRGP
jgi:hypothetical protein